MELACITPIPLGYMDPALWRLSRAEMPSLLKRPASAVQTFVRAACTRRRHPMVRRDAPYSSGQQSLCPRHLRISCRNKPAERLGALGVRPPVYVLPFRSTVAATLGRCGRGRAATGVGMRVLPFLRFCPETGAELTRGRSETMAWRSGSDYLTATKDHILEMQRL